MEDGPDFCFHLVTSRNSSVWCFVRYSRWAKFVVDAYPQDVTYERDSCSLVFCFEDSEILKGMCHLYWSVDFSEACSRLYRFRCLQSKGDFAAFFKVYNIIDTGFQICNFHKSVLCSLQASAQLRRISREVAFFKRLSDLLRFQTYNFSQFQRSIFYESAITNEFYIIFWEHLSQFRRNFPRDCEEILPKNSILHFSQIVIRGLRSSEGHYFGSRVPRRWRHSWRLWIATAPAIPRAGRPAPGCPKPVPLYLQK